MPKTDLSDVKSVIFGCSGTEMTDAEKVFFADQKPYGLILFGRNVDTPDQVRKLISDFRGAVDREDAPVLVDQEGGRVQRLRSPHWFEAPSFGKIGALYDIDRSTAERATRIATNVIAMDLKGLGITVDCSPCLDLSLPETSTVIGDRSFAGSAEIVSTLGGLVVEAFLNAGIIPVIKHMPGHGRGSVDSHHELPTVSATLGALRNSDFVPFKKQASSPWGMTAHIVFEDIDPHWPATQSAKVIQDIIRGEIGFEGLLLTDDLNMDALAGALEDRAARALKAGIDVVLHCSGKLEEMKQVASACNPLTAASRRRIKTAEEIVGKKGTHLEDRAALITELNGLLSMVEVE